MEVAEMTRFTEDPTAGKLSQEAEPVSLTHEELQALSPSERPKNVMVVDRRINSSEDLREQNNLNSLNTLESGSQETSSISESQLSNFSSEQELSSFQESQSHEGVPVPHNQMKLCQQQPELPEPSSILQHSYNPANPSTSHNWEQQTTNNYQNPNAQNSNSTFVTPGYIDRTGPGVQQQQCQPSTSARSEFKYHYQDSIDDANQDKPLDLSKHCGDPAADTSFNDLSKSSETEVVNEISSADKNLINEAIAESNKETFTATADIDTDDIIFPFPEFGNENLEKLLNESPDGNMLIISVEDGKLMLPTLSNLDKDSMNTGDAGESSDLSVNNQISKETEITSDITHDKIDDQDDITSDISTGNNQDNAEGDNINSVIEDSSKDPLALSDDDHDVNDGNDNDLEDDICDSINGSVSLNISDNNENSTYKIEKSVIKVKKLSLPPEVSPQPSRRSSRLSTKNKHLKSKHKSSSNNNDLSLQSPDSGCKNNSKSLSELNKSTENTKTDIKTEKVLRSKLGKGPKNEKITCDSEDKKEEKSKDSPEVTSSRPKRKLGLRPDKVTLEEDDAKENLSASDDEEVFTATKRSKRTRASRQIISDDDEISDNEKKDKVVAKSVRPKRKLEALSEQKSAEEDDQYDFADNEEIDKKPSNKRQKRPLVRTDITKKNPEEIVLSLKRSFRRNIRARDSINSDRRQSSDLVSLN